jgi:hypothetical protein
MLTEKFADDYNKKKSIFHLRVNLSKKIIFNKNYQIYRIKKNTKIFFFISRKSELMWKYVKRNLYWIEIQKLN